MFTLFVLCDVSHMRMPDGYNKAITYLLTYCKIQQFCQIVSVEFNLFEPVEGLNPGSMSEISYNEFTVLIRLLFRVLWIK